MAYSEELDGYHLLRAPQDPTQDDSHDDLVTAFTATLPAPPRDPAETTPNEELELMAAYADWLKAKGELVADPLLNPGVVAERLLWKIKHGEDGAY